MNIIEIMWLYSFPENVSSLIREGWILEKEIGCENTPKFTLFVNEEVGQS